jgi:hypothetical protein
MAWRSSIPIHDAANLFPLIADRDELIKIGNDIKDHGLSSPIGVLVENGNPVLADGRNRLDAMELVGLNISLVKTTSGTWRLVAKENLTEIDINKRIGATVNVVTDDPWDYVISVNMHRRHLTGEQKREIVAKLLNANPEKSNRSIARAAKVDDKTVGAVRRELEATAEIPQLDKRTGKDGKARPAKATSSKPNSPSIDSRRYDVEDAIGARGLFDSQTPKFFNASGIEEAIGAVAAFDSATSPLFEYSSSIFESAVSDPAEANPDQDKILPATTAKSHTLPDINAMAAMPERPWNEEKQVWLDRRLVMAVDILIQSNNWRVNLASLDDCGLASWPIYPEGDLVRVIGDLQNLNKHLARKRKVQDAEDEVGATVPRRGSETLERAKAALRNDPALTKRALMKQTGASSKCAVGARKELQDAGEIPTRAAGGRSKDRGS